MLAFTWIALRFIHFTSLMLVFGFAMYGAWLAPLTIRRLLAKRFLRLQQHAAVWSLISATAMLAVQGGLMGTGWAGNDSNLLIVFYVQIMPDDFVMQLHR
ncbi:hypothetical protein OSK25_21145, partial [Escherichia coli]|nr:hypothetical protein [Escherichia coli]MDA6485095.1 hypothetical protein [Escherichia coli]MDA6542633.1 hypothetical protein [Escherichia coli]